MNSKKNLIIGGAIVASGIGALLYFYLNQQDKPKGSRINNAKHISRELVIKMLKEVQKDMFGTQHEFLIQCSWA